MDAIPTSAPLVEVLWRRRWAVALTAAACLLVGMIYLAVATPVYQASARVYIEENAPSVMRDRTDFRGDSEAYLHTQASVFRSTAVLARALRSLDPASMKTFREAKGDLVDHLQSGDDLVVEAQKKSDVVTVAFQSPYPDEAAAFVNSLVRAYMEEMAHRRQDTGGQMIAVLEKEKQRIQERIDQTLREMLQFKRANNVLSFRDDKGNTALERTATLSASLTQAEIATIELRAQKQAIESALSDPRSLRAWVEAQQFRGREFGDREYDDLRQQLSTAILAHSTALTVQGEKHRNVQLLAARIETLKQHVAEKERSIARAHLVQLGAELAAAEQKEARLRAALAEQQERTLGLGADSIAYEKLAAEVDRLQRQSELIDGRIAELGVNSGADLPLNVQVLEAARVENSPVKPKKALVLLASLMCGCLGGLGLATLREWRDARLRQPEEIPGMLGTPVVSVVPRINPRLSSVTRGQIVHLDARSPVAESYRSIRTALKLGRAADARTILIASPTSGDGKSTSASNLAIAFAQAGERTLLIDCDLRQPVQHMIFETDGSVGISSIMAGECTVSEAVRPTQVPDLFLLACGPVPQNPAELLASARFARLMQTLCESFDRIVIDSPPLTCVTDARVLASAADATLLVLRLNLSIRKDGVEAMELLETVNANVVGAIANDAAPGRGYGSYYGGSWNYASHAKRMLPTANGSGAAASRETALAAATNGNGSAREQEASRLAAQLLEIREPNWSAEVRP